MRSTLRTLCFLACVLAVAQVQAQRGRYYYRPAHYYPVIGQRFGRIPGAYVSLQFGGNPFYYSSGLFYRPYGSYFAVTAPPFGIHVNILPRGYWPLRVNNYPYFYYNGSFYRQTASDYEVVQAPVGADVPSIPRDAKTTVIDGEKYYEYNGNYFKDHVKPNGELWYTVVGKHGVLNTDKSNISGNYTEESAPQDNRPAIGEVFDNLPADTKTIVLNNKKYYLSSDNVYYEEVMDGRQRRFRVAGK